jgi:hypothetical protein
MIKWSIYTSIGFVVACIINWFAVPCLSWSTIQGIFMLILALPLAIPALGRRVGVRNDR